MSAFGAARSVELSTVGRLDCWTARPSGCGGRRGRPGHMHASIMQGSRSVLSMRHLRRRESIRHKELNARALTIIVTGYRGQHTVSPQHSRSVKSLFRLGASWPTEAHLVKPHGQAPNNGESAGPLLGSRLQSTKTFGHNAQSYLALNYAPYQATVSSTTRSISIWRLFEPPDAISACWRALVCVVRRPHTYLPVVLARHQINHIRKKSKQAHCLGHETCDQVQDLWHSRS